MKHFISCVTWYTSFPTSSSDCKFLENKDSLFSVAIKPCGAWWGLRGCSAHQVLIGVGVQQDLLLTFPPSAVLGSGVEWGVSRERLLICQGLRASYIGKRTHFSPWGWHPQCQWMKDSGAKQRWLVMSPFLLLLKYCLSLIQTSELMLWHPSCGSLTISLGHFEPQFSYF